MQANRPFSAIALPGGASRTEQVLAVVFIWLAAVSLGLVAEMAVERAGEPGYDFRYFWLAGTMWSDGVSPYGAAFGETGARLITEGHVPEIWPYPPNLWLPSVALAQFDLSTSWHIWLCIQLLALPAASAALALWLPQERIPGATRHSMRVTRLGFFCLHLVLMSSLEATHLSVYVGQSSVLIYLAAALVVAGLARGRRGMVVAGLVVIFMKPQIGAAVALGLMLMGRAGLRPVILATLASLLLIVPPMVVKADVVLDWLMSLGDYDGVTLANMAVAMTGIRHLLWIYGGVDIGNIAAMGVTLMVCIGVALHQRTVLVRRGECWNRAAPDLMIAQVLVILAFSPLHMYDFVLFGVACLALSYASGPRIPAALIGAAMFVKPTDVFVWLQGARASTFFPGSTMATIGALILLLVVLTRRTAAPASAV